MRRLSITPRPLRQKSEHENLPRRSVSSAHFNDNTPDYRFPLRTPISDNPSIRFSETPNNVQARIRAGVRRDRRDRGGDQNDGHSLEPGGSIAYLLTRKIAVGAEYRGVLSII